jgi:hypothetical protein
MNERLYWVRKKSGLDKWIVSDAGIDKIFYHLTSSFPYAVNLTVPRNQKVETFILALLRWITRQEYRSFKASDCVFVRYAVNTTLVESERIAWKEEEEEKRPVITSLLLHWSSHCSPAYLSLYTNVLKHFNQSNMCCKDATNIILQFLYC